MKKVPKISIYNLIFCLLETVELFHPELVNHFLQVGYIAISIAKKTTLTDTEILDLAIASLLHDIGALQDKFLLEKYQYEHLNIQNHVNLGYRVLKDFLPFQKAAYLIQFHHYIKQAIIRTELFPFQQKQVQILRIAEKIALGHRSHEILGFGKSFKENFEKIELGEIHPEVKKAFLEVSDQESFWFNIEYRQIKRLIKSALNFPEIQMDMNLMLKFSKVIINLIEFWSPFSAFHSCGVAATAQSIGKIMNFDQVKCQKLRIAGYLHDLGKLAIPLEILDKPGKLNDDEFNIIKSHVYYSYQILQWLKGFEEIVNWGSFHHEKLDGTGYPFKLKGTDLSIESQLMAVADIFTALREDRPYREGMPKDKALGILSNMATNGLNQEIVNLVINNYDLIDGHRYAAHNEATIEGKELRRRLDNLEF